MDSSSKLEEDSSNIAFPAKEIPDKPNNTDESQESTPEIKLSSIMAEAQTEKKNTENESDQLIQSKNKQSNQLPSKTQIFISNPELIEGIKKYITYKVYGNRITTPLSRKYSDFCYLREKLVERWPGVFIPTLPLKTDNDTDNQTVEMNIRLINRFCNKLLSIPFLSKSAEIHLFFSNVNNAIQEMERLPVLYFKDIIDRYKASIPIAGDLHAYDLAKAKEQLEDQYCFVYELLNNVKNLTGYARETMVNKTKEINNYLCLLNVFEDYEKHALIEYANNEERKLVFSNKHNKELKEKHEAVVKSLRNPYVSLIEWIEEDESDLKGMMEVFEAINHLESEYKRLNEQVKQIETDIIKHNNGEATSYFWSFKSTSEIVAELQHEKEVNQIGMYYLDLIIKMVSDYSIKTFDSFKQSKLSDYYQHLKQFNTIQMMNNKCLIDFWKFVQMDNNVKLKQ